MIVNPVNDPPVLDFITDQQIDEDTSLIYDVLATDVDNISLNYFAVVVDGSGSAGFEGSVLTVTPDLDFNGSLLISIAVSDDEYTVNDSFVLLVEPVNDAPVVDVIGDQEIDEDVAFAYNLTAIDVDGDELSYTVSIDGNGDASIDGTDLTTVSYTHLTLPTTPYV